MKYQLPFYYITKECHCVSWRVLLLWLWCCFLMMSC